MGISLLDNVDLEARVQCQDCGHIYTTWLKKDANGCYDMCPACHSNIGSYRLDDTEEVEEC